MQAQTILNVVTRHLLKQNRKSERQPGMCLYRGPDNTSCAVGCLIPPAMYYVGMEGCSVDALLERYPEVSDLLGVSNIELLKYLQNTHDCFCVENWPERLRIIAQGLSLELPAELVEVAE